MQKKYILFLSSFIFSFLMLLIQESYALEQKEKLRIISLAPSVTETILALGLEDNLVGISTYCREDEGLDKALPRLGTGKLFSPEAVLALEPDLVFGIEENPFPYVPYYYVPSKSLEDVLNAFLLVAKLCNVEEKGQAYYDEALLFIEEIRNKSALRPRQKILFSLQRQKGIDGIISECISAGEDGYFSELLEILNVENATKSKLPYPLLNFELIYKANPDVIIDIVSPETQKELSADDWHNMPLNAVKNKKVYATTNGLVPGPRFKDFLLEMEEYLN